MNKRLDEIKNNIFTNWDIAVNKGGETIAELKQLYEQTGDPECLWLISELLIHKARGGLQEAIIYATEALSLRGDSDALHENFAVALGGYTGEFKNRNHRQLIEYYSIFCRLYPDSFIARKILILNLLDDYRLEEAETEIARAFDDFPDAEEELLIYRGEFYYRSGKPRKAKQVWKEVAETVATARIHYELAEVYAKFGLYKPAERQYKKSFAMEEPPRRIDALISLIHISEIRGDYRAALRYNNKIIEVFKKDYNITSGLELQTFINNKDKYQSLLFE
ncbi:MAG: hypothetical protein QM208_00690 [Bacillota bacterium]|jgi:tetratricopeptide (TPR) repeat protein|nr:hypothetical protein [Bacillota bacterium]HOA78695.1 hypothetical protein [Bacilli bacterium]HPZ27385.1 hypothetical protein [Bacilli bacterium]HQC89708.1 hypothetical protein [Bacilli bacterium]